MTERKYHLITATTHAVRRAACGVVNPPRWTKIPANVTCVACSRSLAMADAEVRSRFQTRRNRPG